MDELSWDVIFNGWGPVLRTVIRGALGYIGLVVLLRVSGKRTLSKMNAFDFVVTVAFGSLLASILVTQNVSLLQGIVAIALLILLQAFNTFLAVRSERYRRFIKAQPSLIFFKGKFLVEEMKRERVTREEILSAMRQQGMTEPTQVDAVVIETEGTLSVMGNQAASAEALVQLGVNVGDSIGKPRVAIDPQ